MMNKAKEKLKETIYQLVEDQVNSKVDELTKTLNTTLAKFTEDINEAFTTINASNEQTRALVSGLYNLENIVDRSGYLEDASDTIELSEQLRATKIPRIDAASKDTIKKFHQVYLDGLLVEWGESAAEGDYILKSTEEGTIVFFHQWLQPGTHWRVVGLK
jgi:hypothetical protein